MIMPPYPHYPLRGSADPLVIFSIRARINMKTFLGLLILSITVSGNEEKQVEGVLGQDILLPCSCSSRLENTEVRWQIKKPIHQNPNTVLTYNGNTSISQDYKGRVEIFLSEDDNNCSLVLSNLTLADQGTYSCHFYKPHYRYIYINLNVYVSYTVCQRSHRNGLKERVQCDVEQQFPEDEIQWQLDGQPLKIPFTGNTANPSTGLQLLRSNFTMDLNESSELKCVVKNPNIMINITYDCPEPHVENPSKIQGSRLVTASVIPLVITVIVLLLVVSLVWISKRISKRGVKENRGEVTNSDLERLNASEHSKC